MKYTLKDYQQDAVRDVLDNLRKAARAWREDGDLSAFSLTANTGAGKTVMAAAVIEALFAGDAENDFAPDPGAVVLWFTDDPSLNEQTRARLAAASDRLDQSGRLVVIENSFAEEKLQPGKVYFLNSQKLSKNALLVRGATPDEAKDGQWSQSAFAAIPPPDNRSHTMWDILRATIEDDKLTLYMVLDEAHRGMKPNRERGTIVQRLINGASGAPPIPVVFGISATVQRFDEAMKAQIGRTIRPPVLVDPARVQESGLLKDDIRLDFPREAGAFDMTLLGRAARQLEESTQRWQDYIRREKLPDDAVVPLMVVQVPNKSTDETLLQAVSTIRRALPTIQDDAFANVFGEHKDLELGGTRVAYMEPQRVQDRPHVRVLFAKDAISTGWDCPRAEVFISFRPANDLTYITQLIGRMVRAPLARRVPGNDLLNSVACILPKFDRKTANQVAKAMTGDRGADADGTGGGDGRRTLTDPLDMPPNAEIAASVWQAFDQLPSETLPRKSARAITRCLALAQALSYDGLRQDAVKEAQNTLCKTLNGFSAMHPDELTAATEEVTTVAGETLAIKVHTGVTEDVGSFTEVADDAAIDAHYRAARRKLGGGLAKLYAERIADKEYEGDLREGHIRVAALGRVEGVAEAIDEAADKLAKAWFGQHRVGIKGLSDERSTAYDDIKGMSPEPQRIDVQRPRIRTENTKDEEGKLLDTRSHHLMVDENGQFPVGSLNEWELKVLDAEMAREGFAAWYRNPSRPSPDALAVPWQDAAGNWRRMCPDFVFFHKVQGKITASIVDPHGIHLADALPKLRGLARFAEAHGAELHRIEAVAKVGEDLRVLDLQNAEIRAAVEETAAEIEALYLGKHSAEYR